MSSRPTIATRDRRPARGGAYVLVLIAVSIATGAALAAISLSRAGHALAVAQADGSRAEVAAASALELAVARIAARSDWRTYFALGTIVAEKNCDGAEITVVASDPKDGDLAAGDSDAFELLATSQAGAATRSIRASVEPYREPLLCLRSALHAAGNITFSSTSTLNSDAVVSSNGSISAVLSTVSAPVEATGSIFGLTYLGARTTGTSARPLPAWSDILAAYAAVGTPIAVSSLSKSTLEKIALGPGANPYGAADPDGVYLIDCQGADLIIQNCRIVATLVLKNARTVTINESVSLQPASGSEACLVVSGSLVLNPASVPLSEQDNNCNYNPAGAPDGDSTDSDKNDTYANELRGIVYASDGITFQQTNTVVRGVVLSGGKVTLDVGAAANLRYSSLPSIGAPPAFQGSLGYRVLSGTVTRIFK